MNLRRIPMLTLAVVVFVGVVIDARETVAPVDAVFSNVSAPWMPAAPLPGGLNSTWFCPGVPAGGEAGSGGVVTVFNTEDTAMRGRLTVLRVDGDPVTQPLDVPAYQSQTVDLDELIDSPFAAAVVEIDGGGGLVEQQARHERGVSVATCANATGDEWYFATGDTMQDSDGQLVLANPHDYAAVVDIVMATERGLRTRERYTQFPVPPRTVRVVDLNDLFEDESELSVGVIATRGRIVAGRSQVYDTDDRRGYVMSLGAPALREQWWFAYGGPGGDAVETYTIYNPGRDDVEVTPVPLGFATPDDWQPPESIVVRGGARVSFDIAEIQGLPDGPHSIVFGASEGRPIVVERVLTRTIDGVPTTSTTLGATARPTDGYIATTWYTGIGATAPVEDALAIYNYTVSDAVITVQAITPDGVQNVPGLEEVVIEQSAVGFVDLVHEMTVGNELIVRSTTPVFVERVLPRDEGTLGRVASWAVPANA